MKHSVRWLVTASVVTLSLVSPSPAAQVKPAGDQDHKNMMEQLGIRALRPGANPNDQSTFDEATANRWPLPELMTMKNGKRVTSAKQWPARRAEIAEAFEREVYGRIPKNVPKVTWTVAETTRGELAGVPTITKKLVGHVDNSAYPALTVDIQASVTTPANAAGPVPVMVEFDAGWRFGKNPLAWQELLVSKGWGYGTITPASIQADGPALTSGIIGLTNKGRPRKPDDWGALRAWQWGVSRLLDYFETDKAVDAKQVGIEGLSRYGKAALVTLAFEPRIAVAFVASSGEGGAKLHRRAFGEIVENLTGSGEYHWMAGNFLKYGASEATFGAKTAGDIPVDAHQLIAMCAPRPCFISYGTIEGGDPNWVDARGSFMAAVAAGPAYRLLGKRDLGTPGNYLTDPMPAVGQLIGGELAWRQHSGGHSAAENWPSFIEWASRFIKVMTRPDQPVARTDENSRIAHAELLAKAKTGRIDVYFEGDSITRRWGTSDEQYEHLFANWRENFFGWNAGNFGWGGDTVQNILWRLHDGELDGVDPKIIVLLAGTNNIGTAPPRGDDDPRIAEISEGIRAIVGVFRQKAPDATIVLTGIFPRNDNIAVMSIVDRVNANIAKLADGKRIRYVNVNDRLADKSGRLYQGVADPDGLHMGVKAYQAWADALKPIFTEILGPPARDDHAPPPTGDPSARRTPR